MHHPVSHPVRAVPSTLAATLLPAALLLLAAPRAPASEVSAYLPLNLAPALEARVERVLALAGVTVLERPIRVETVAAALGAACRIDAPLCAQVRRDLRRYQQDWGVSHAGVEAAAVHGGRPRSAAPALQATPLIQPNQYGAPMDARWQANLGAYLGLGSHVLLNGGAVAYPGRVNPTGSYLSVGTARAQIDVGFRPHWWSPLQDSSMLIGTEAATMPSVTVSNTDALTRLGIRYEVFLARMSYSNHIVWNYPNPGAPGGYSPGFTSGYPRLAGFHVSFEPVAGWSVGVSRLMQYGGGLRGGNSIKDFFKTFANASKYENLNAGQNSNSEFGNEQVEFSSSLLVPARRPVALYFDYAAEDSFHSENYRFGSGALSGGFFLPELRPNLQLRYEFSEWQSNWYTHHIFQDGMSNYGVVDGNWGADWRQFNASVGAQSQMLALSWQSPRGFDLDVHYRTVQNGRGSGIDYKRAHELSLQWAEPWSSFELGGEVDGGRDEYGSAFARLGLFVRLDGAARPPVSAGEAMHAEEAGGAAQAGAGASGADQASAPSSRYERFVSMGMALSHLDYERDAGAVPPLKTYQGSAHLGFGARRLGDAHSDLGAGIDLDNIRGRLFTGLRALDYRYRMGSSLALTAFFGAGRYAARTPAYGWYAGVGAQWRNLFPGWDASVEYRDGDHLVRNKVLPGEVTIIYPNEFYSFKGEAIYVSRRF